MHWEKWLTQAAFATVLCVMALLPVTTYGCLKLQQVEEGRGSAAPDDGAARSGR